MFHIHVAIKAHFNPGEDFDPIFGENINLENKFNYVRKGLVCFQIIKKETTLGNF